MVTATVLVIIFSPLFYVLIVENFSRRYKKRQAAVTAGTDGAAGSGGTGGFFKGLKEKLQGKFRKEKPAETTEAAPPRDQ
jgi:hypothetical protein